MSVTFASPLLVVSDGDHRTKTWARIHYDLVQDARDHLPYACPGYLDQRLVGFDTAQGLSGPAHDRMETLVDFQGLDEGPPMRGSCSLLVEHRWWVVHLFHRHPGVHPGGAAQVQVARAASAAGAKTNPFGLLVEAAHKQASACQVRRRWSAKEAAQWRDDLCHQRPAGTRHRRSWLQGGHDTGFQLLRDALPPSVQMLVSLVHRRHKVRELLAGTSWDTGDLADYLDEGVPRKLQDDSDHHR